MLAIRKELIVQAASDVPLNAVHEIQLTPPKSAAKRISNRLTQSFNEGQRQIREQSSKGAVDDLIQRLVELTLSRTISEVQSAAASIIAALGVLGLDRSEIEERIKQDLDDRSDAPFERIAAQAVNKAVNEGRRAEMDALSDSIDRFEYSAILDKNTCGPCEEWDGKTAASMDDLPETPNPDCEGQASCRCFIIAIFESENN